VSQPKHNSVMPTSEASRRRPARPVVVHDPVLVPMTEPQRRQAVEALAALVVVHLRKGEKVVRVTPPEMVGDGN
jgi:hypothetical protein